tara:strand:- start:84 stop:221 length:138 start_codon:yes stop_codon:yes gene_type:complete
MMILLAIMCIIFGPIAYGIYKKEGKTKIWPWIISIIGILILMKEF